MIRRPPRSTRTDTPFPTRRSSDLLGADYNAPVDFTVSFGASEATITYLGETTLPAGTRVFVQFDELGAGASRPDFGVALPAGSPWSNICAVNPGVPPTADRQGELRVGKAWVG